MTRHGTSPSRLGPRRRKTVMSSKKKKKPIPQYQPTPEEQRAIDLHKQIGETEEGVVPLYLELGLVLKGIKEERKFDWQGLLTHATENLGLNRSYIVRA